MKAIFDKYVETSFDGAQQSAIKQQQFTINYRALFSGATAGAVLDIGVGRGEMLSCMKDWGLKYHGIDISPSTIRCCQALNLSCELVEDSAEWLSRHPAQFAAITCLDVLEHVPRERVIDFLQAIRESLDQGGIAIVQVPNLQSPWGYLHHFNDFTHVSGFVEHSLAQVLLAAGFTKFEFFGFEEIFKSGPKQVAHRLLRTILRKCVRFLRRVNANPNPAILDPVLYVVARR